MTVLRHALHVVARHAALILLALLISLVGLSRPVEAREPLIDIIKAALEVRGDIMQGLGTWKRAGHAAADRRDEQKSYDADLTRRSQAAYDQATVSPAQFMRLKEIVVELDAAAQRDFTERRSLNQRMMIRARQSEVFSRLPVISLVRKKWIYSDERAEAAVKGSTTLQSVAAEIDALKAEAEKILSEKPAAGTPCSEAEKQAIANQINDLNGRWADRWCRPIWSGCGEPALSEANGLRYILAGAATAAQCAWVQEMAACKDNCMMNYPGDAGAAQRAQCLADCTTSLPAPGN